MTAVYVIYFPHQLAETKEQHLLEPTSNPDRGPDIADEVEVYYPDSSVDSDGSAGGAKRYHKRLLMSDWRTERGIVAGW
ncbi:hypothetical protein V501_01380 [Pseudogymnoascus sp. VKM F-4519 (FW-2642)]|nr:hypothetical protein V501_01380 [Pseudogymnoascus sp. VKM F-4519 (FW-2642)]